MSELSVPQALSIAVQLHQRGQLVDAEVLYNRILSVQPHHTDALHYAGVLAHQTGRQDLALALLSRAASLAPTSAAILNNLGETLRVLYRIEEAVDCYRRSIALNPADPMPHSNLGNVLCLLGDLESAAAACGRAISLEPRHAAAHINLGNVRLAQRRFEEAITCFDLALGADPELSQAHCARGIALFQCARYDEALHCFDQAVQLCPDYADAQARRAFPLLLRGDMERGWEAYEWRRRVPGFAAVAQQFDRPLWDGESLKDRTLLIHAEEGFGDTFQWVRYAIKLAAETAPLRSRIVLQCQPEILPLLREIPSLDVVARGDSLPHFDLHVPMGSLPRILRTNLRTIPDEVPYLRAGAPQIAAWRTRLANPRRESMRVGLLWTGSTSHPLNADRSISPELLDPLGGIDDVWFISLQKDANRTALTPALQVTDYSGELSDFGETAALIECLDLVITVDTAVAHLAGAMGKPVWLLLANPPEWRWLLDRSDSPWYPSMTLFRQPHCGDWPPVIAVVAERLKALAAGTTSQ